MQLPASGESFSAAPDGLKLAIAAGVAPSSESPLMRLVGDIWQLAVAKLHAHDARSMRLASARFKRIIGFDSFCATKFALEHAPKEVLPMFPAVELRQLGFESLCPLTRLKQLSVLEAEFLLDQPEEVAVLSTLQQLTSLYVERLPHELWQPFAAAVHRLPNLRELELDSCGLHTNKEAVMLYLPALTSHAVGTGDNAMHVSNCSLTIGRLRYRHLSAHSGLFASVRELAAYNISPGCDLRSLVHLELLQLNCEGNQLDILLPSQLQSLSIGCMHAPPPQAKAFLAPLIVQLPLLNKLEAYFLQWSAQDCEWGQGLSALHTIVLGYGSDDLTQVANLTSLQKLSFVLQPQTTCPPSAPRNLHELRIHNESGVSALPFLSQPTLSALRFLSSYAFEAPMVALLAQQAPHLRWLALESMPVHADLHSLTALHSLRCLFTPHGAICCTPLMQLQHLHVENPPVLSRELVPRLLELSVPLEWFAESAAHDFQRPDLRMCLPGVHITSPPKPVFGLCHADLP